MQDKNSSRPTVGQGSQTRSDSSQQNHLYPRTLQILRPAQSRWAVFKAQNSQAPNCQAVELIALQEELSKDSAVQTSIVQLIASQDQSSEDSFENPEDSDNFIGYISRQERPTTQDLVSFASEHDSSSSQQQSRASAR